MNLDEIIEDEYSKLVASENPFGDKVLDMLKELKGNEEVGDEFGIVTNYEKHAFDQGFLRGLAAARNSLVIV